jgi:hypothetical protein
MMCAIVIALLELAAYALSQLSLHAENPYLLYPANYFDTLSDRIMEREANADPLGWPANDAPRAQPAVGASTCAAAFGDSFTHGHEGGDDETWPYRLSVALGCSVANFGVGGYGLDQAILRYERIRPRTQLVILGLYVEMLRRDVAASWIFYARSPAPAHFNVTKPLFHLAETGLELIPRPMPATRAAVELHHRHDFYRQNLWTALAFPHTLSFGRAIYRHYVADVRRFYRDRDSFWLPSHPSASYDLTLRLLHRLSTDVERSGARLVLVFLPTQSQLLADRVSYETLMQDVPNYAGGACLIDVWPQLSRHARSSGLPALVAPKGHFSALGNQVIATAVEHGLARCAQAR